MGGAQAARLLTTPAWLDRRHSVNNISYIFICSLCSDRPSLSHLSAHYRQSAFKRFIFLIRTEAKVTDETTIKMPT